MREGESCEKSALHGMACAPYKVRLLGLVVVHHADVREHLFLQDLARIVDALFARYTLHQAYGERRIDAMYG